MNPRSGPALRRRARWIAVAIALLLLALPWRHARSQAEDQRPWAKGVPGSEQAIAFELYRAANVEFAESRFAQALVRYREAIRHWDHPQIRYNLAICLVNLDRLVEAKDSLDRSLAYGERALGSDHYEQGLRLRERLAAQLATIEIASQEPRVDVALDGELLLRSPGAARAVVLPGVHQIMVTAPALPVLSHTVVVVAATTVRYAVEDTVKLAGPGIQHVLELQELGAEEAPRRRVTASQARPPPAPPPPLNGHLRPASFTWEVGAGLGAVWARSDSGDRALYETWRDLVAGARMASRVWSDPIPTWSFGLGGGRWISDNVALSLRLVWTSFNFTDGTIFNVVFSGASLQYWPVDHVWIGGGPGFGRADISPSGDGMEGSSRVGFGQNLRAGCTFNTRSKITFNLSIELTSTIFNIASGPEDATIAVLIGAQRSMAPH